METDPFEPTAEPTAETLPAVAVVLHILAVLDLAASVGVGLYRSYKDLSRSPDVRPQLARRARLAPAFAALAVLGFVLAGYSSVQYAALSFRVWAHQRPHQLPSLMDGAPALDYAARLYHVKLWLTETAVYHDALEVVAEQARRFWWGQQINLGMVPWALFLAIEGRRRRIPYLLAYLSLAHFASLAAAQNMFYLALLLTPSPLPEAADDLPPTLARVRDAVFPPKPSNWCPSPLLFLGLLALSYSSVLLMPYAAGTTWFSTVAIWFRLSTYAFLVMPALIPLSWGTVHAHPHDAYGAFNTLFRVASAVSTALHWKATLLGLVINTPSPSCHRHSFKRSCETAERSAWERTATPIDKILGSTADHPAVAAVGHDMLLSAFSLGLWAAVRALDSNDILLSAIPFYRSTAKSAADGVAVMASVEARGANSDEVPATTLEKGGRAARARASSSSHPEVPASVPRRRGRPRKVKAVPEEVPENDPYWPAPDENTSIVEGVVPPAAEEVDWESAALSCGLAAVGGLGCATAGVLGGECISR